MAQDDAERDVRKTIRHWQVRGVTAAMAWQALGHARDHAGWDQVRAYMVRWLLAEHVAVERLAA